METAREATAYHEAGHAVIGRKLNLVCGDVSIEETAEWLGFAEITSPERLWERGDGPKRSHAEAFAIALYAGAEAERFFLGTTDVGDSADVERAMSALAWGGVRGATFVGDEAFDRAEARLRAEAARLVRFHSAAIRSAAQRLIEQGKLAADQVLSPI